MMYARLGRKVREYRIWHTLGTLHPASLQPGPGLWRIARQSCGTYHVGTRGTFELILLRDSGSVGGLSSARVHAQSELAFLCCMIRSLMLLRTFLQTCMARKARLRLFVVAAFARMRKVDLETHSHALSRAG
jgi:hypothetical protein